MARYVTVDGATHFSTPDLNLLPDADTAHVYQSIGEWTGGSNTTRTHETDAAASHYGGKVLQAVVIAADTDPYIQNGAGTDGFPVSAETQYAFSAYGYTATASRTLHTRIYYYNAAGGSISDAWAASPTALAASTKTQHSQTFTTPALTAYIRVKMMFRDAGGGVDVDAGDTVKISGLMLAAGSDSTFYPSLRIVGALFEDKDPSAMPIGFASDGTPLTVGAGWAGDAYHYRRYDGADASAPLVAAFEVEDVPYVA